MSIIEVLLWLGRSNFGLIEFDDVHLKGISRLTHGLKVDYKVALL